MVAMPEPISTTRRVERRTPTPVEIHPRAGHDAPPHLRADASLPRTMYVSFAKRLVDIVIATILLLGIAPALVVVALLIRLDSHGSAIFTQWRVGRDGRLFRMYKFRTMIHDPASTIEWHVDEQGGVYHKKERNNARVTQVGRVLRRTSIDELPQLINVLKGDMSLIGPRPELVEIVERYEPWQHERHMVRPGLTGWWQVSGRTNVRARQKTELDLFYVHRISLALDVTIALMTIRIVLSGRGAY